LDLLPFSTEWSSFFHCIVTFCGSGSGQDRTQDPFNLKLEYFQYGNLSLVKESMYSILPIIQANEGRKMNEKWKNPDNPKYFVWFTQRTKITFLLHN
jgi:hypothetical protein